MEFLQTLTHNGVGYRPLPFTDYHLEVNEKHLCTFKLWQLQHNAAWEQVLSIQWKCHITTKNLIFEQAAVPDWHRNLERLLPKIADMFAPAAYSVVKSKQRKEAMAFQEECLQGRLSFAIPLHEIQSIKLIPWYLGGAKMSVIINVSDDYNVFQENYRGFMVTLAQENQKNLSLGFFERMLSQYQYPKDFIKIIEYYKQA